MLLVSSKTYTKYGSSVSQCDISFCIFCQISKEIRNTKNKQRGPRSAICIFFLLISERFADRMQWCLFAPLSLITCHLLWYHKLTAPDECLFTSTTLSYHLNSSFQFYLPAFFNACNINEWGSAFIYTL